MRRKGKGGPGVSMMDKVKAVTPSRLSWDSGVEQGGHEYMCWGRGQQDFTSAKSNTIVDELPNLQIEGFADVIFKNTTSIKSLRCHSQKVILGT